MIRITEDRLKVGGVALGAIYVGNSTDEQTAEVTSILNVAQDLISTRGWDDGIESMHVGLIDGPGNELSTYCSAVLALHALLRRHNVLVCCHTGGRAIMVAMMYLHVSNYLQDRGWCDWWYILQERIEEPLPTPNQVHIEAFDKIDWKLLSKLMR